MMRSKISFCNKRLLAIELKGHIPAMIAVLIIYFSFGFIPEVLRLINESEVEIQNATAYAIKNILDMITNPVLIGAVCICMAVITFSYGYKKTSSYMLHSLPVSRLQYFGTFSMSVLITMSATVLVCYLSLIPMVGGYGWLYELVILGFVNTMVQMLFFFALALLTVVVCGNAFLSLATYGVLNALWVFAKMILSFVNSLLLYHPIVKSYGGNALTDTFYDSFSMLFPAGFFINCNSSLQVDEVDHIITGAGDYLGCLWMLIPAVILFVISALLYNRKKLEKTGEMVAFDWCKIVFRVLFTVCMAGLVFGGVIYLCSGFIVINENRPMIVTMTVVLLLIGGIIGFIVSEMLLQKTVHILKNGKTRFLQGGIIIGAMALYLVLLTTGVIGPKLLPSYDNVDDVWISLEGTDAGDLDEIVFYKNKDPEIVKSILEKQNELINDTRLKNDANAGFGYDSSGEMHYAVMFRFGAGDQVYISEFSVNKETINQVLDSFLPYVKDGAHMAYSMLGSNPKKLNTAEINFSNFSDKNSIKWNNKAFVKEVDISNGEDTPDGEFYYDYYDNTGKAVKPSILHIEDVEKLPENDGEGNNAVRLGNVNNTDLYYSILADMDEGTVLPYTKKTAVYVGDQKADDVICQVNMMLYISDPTREEDPDYIRRPDEMHVSLCLTPESKNTIDLLKKAGAIE